MGKSKEQKEDGRIIIKKYSNRRLYDMTHSRYLTIDQMVELIKQGYEVQVVDSKSKQDITQSVLTQVFLETNGTYLFSASFLHRLIRNRDGILGDFFTDFVPKLLDHYIEMTDTMKRQISTITSPRAWLAATTKDFKKSPDNPETEKLQEEDTSEASPQEAETAKKAKESSDEVGMLKQKLRELEARINKMQL